jgi:hypothetical protein
LQNVVIDLEVEAGTPSPTVDPSVHVILIGHSMGSVVLIPLLLLQISYRSLAEVLSQPKLLLRLLRSSRSRSLPRQPDFSFHISQA